MDAASTVTLGAIAMQGVRRALLTLGESVLVVGLGILGQITVQLLRTNGCRVIGVDVRVAVPVRDLVYEMDVVERAVPGPGLELTSIAPVAASVDVEDPVPVLVGLQAEERAHRPVVSL